MPDYTPTIPFPTCSDLSFAAGVDGVLNITAPMTISSTVPDPPYPPLCHCMARTLACGADPSHNISAIYLSMRHICTTKPAYCRAVTSSGPEGFYPPYRFCNITERAGWAFNQNYLASNSTGAAACAAAGGLLQEPTPPRMAGPECDALLRQAGPSGTGVITFTPGASAGHPPAGGGGARVGSIVGGVLAAVAAVAVAAGLALWHRARRRGDERRQRALVHEMEEDRGAAEAKVGGGGGGGGGGGDGAAEARELDGTAQVEIGGNETYEMAGDSAPPLEMDGEAAAELFELEGEGSIRDGGGPDSIGGVGSPVSPLTVAGTPKSATTWAEGTLR
jgi:hypothetical protein